jgi:glycine betaine/proline transport system ATP-binding protein
MVQEVPTVSPDVLLNELFEMMSAAKFPVAVVNENKRIVGAIVRGAVLGALAGQIPRAEVKADVAAYPVGSLD